MPITAHERRDLLRTERSRDPDAIALAIRRVLADNPTAGLLEIEMMLRAAASSAFVIADGDGFRVVIGFRAWRDAACRRRRDAGSEPGGAGDQVTEITVTAVERASIAANFPSPRRSPRRDPTSASGFNRHTAAFHPCLGLCANLKQPGQRAVARPASPRRAQEPRIRKLAERKAFQDTPAALENKKAAHTARSWGRFGPRFGTGKNRPDLRHSSSVNAR